MKTIGLIGTTSYESTLNYFQIVNQTVNQILGDRHSAKCVISTADFYEIEQALAMDDWEKLSQIVVDAALTLEQAGADFIVLCTNALHRLIPDIQKSVRAPVLNLAEIVADELVEAGMETVGVLGTKYMMAQSFYRPVLRARGVEAILPTVEQIELVHSIIFNELCLGVVKEKSRREVLGVIDSLCERGAEGIILACTEIAMLIRQTDTDVPLFDTQLIHAERAAKLALG
jgi:aspartate racemase